MEKVEIKKLIEQCLNYFYESGYAKGSIDYYKCLWTKGILQYMSDKGIDMYTLDVGAEFIESTQHQGMSNHECERIRSIHALNDIMTVGYVRKQCVRAAIYPLDGAIGKTDGEVGSTFDFFTPWQKYVKALSFMFGVIFCIT